MTVYILNYTFFMHFYFLHKIQIVSIVINTTFCINVSTKLSFYSKWEPNSFALRALCTVIIKWKGKESIITSTCLYILIRIQHFLKANIY